MHVGPRLVIQLTNGSFQELSLETKSVSTMADLQEAVADACESALPESEQDHLGELVMQMIDADGVACTVTERMSIAQLLGSPELRLVAKQTAAGGGAEAQHTATATACAAAPLPKLPPPPAAEPTLLLDPLLHGCESRHDDSGIEAGALSSPPPDPGAQTSGQVLPAMPATQPAVRTSHPSAAELD